MFIFLKLIYTADDDLNCFTPLNTIDDIKNGVIKLIPKLLSIEEDFKLMEMHFHEKFNTLIDEYQNILNHIYFDYFKEKEKQERKQREEQEEIKEEQEEIKEEQEEIKEEQEEIKEEQEEIKEEQEEIKEEQEEIKEEQEVNKRGTTRKIDTSVSLALYNALKSYLIPQILPKIVFESFLMFYDEYSYAINERIMKVYEKYEYVKKASKKFSYLGILSPKYQINKISLESVKYRDIHYFHDKLEEKLNKKLKISIPKIRSILFGCNPDDVGPQLEQIQKYYSFITVYKHYYCPNYAHKNLFMHLCYYVGINYPNQYKALTDSVYEHVTYFYKDIPYLYDYHKTIPKTFTVSKTRFRVFEKILNKYDQWGKPTSDFNEEDKELFSAYNYGTDDEIKLNFREVILSYISYQREQYIEFYLNLEKMKRFLQMFLR